MTIEFSCQNCLKMLSAPDDKAGYRAKCPECNQISAIPDLEQETEKTSLDFDSPIFEDDKFQLDEMTTCPVCSGLIDASVAVPKGAIRTCTCNYTPQVFMEPVRGENWEPRKISVVEVFSRTCDLYKKKLGLCVTSFFGCSLFAYLSINVAIYMVSFVISGSFILSIGLENWVLLFFTSLLIPICMAVVIGISGLSICYFLSGFQSVLLNLAQGQNPGFGYIFSGGPFIWRMYFSTALVAILLAVGYSFLIIPGFILTMYFWPYGFVIIDRNEPDIKSISKAPKLANGNLKSLTIIFLPIVSLAFVSFKAQKTIKFFFEDVMILSTDLSAILTTGLCFLIAAFIFSFVGLLLAVTYVEITKR